MANLLFLLPGLRIVVLFGGKAQTVRSWFQAERPELPRPFSAASKSALCESRTGQSDENSRGAESREFRIGSCNPCRLSLAKTSPSNLQAGVLHPLLVDQFSLYRPAISAEGLPVLRFDTWQTIRFEALLEPMEKAFLGRRQAFQKPKNDFPWVINKRGNVLTITARIVSFLNLLLSRTEGLQMEPKSHFAQTLKATMYM